MGEAPASSGAGPSGAPPMHDPAVGRGRSMTPRRRTLRLAVIVLVVYGAYAIMLYSIQRSLIFPRHFTDPDPTGEPSVRGVEKIWLDTPEGKVEAWYLRGIGALADQPGPAVIFAHGNAELIEHWPSDMLMYVSAGVSVLLPEFRGYGRSAGSPSQKAITEDFVRFYDLLAARPEVDATRIVFHGRSVGGGALCALATRRPPAAMVLQSTFTSITDLSRRYLVPRFLVSDPFDNLSVVSALDCPLILFHGRRDSIIPFEHAERLHAAAKDSTLVAYDVDHNDCPPNWIAFMHDVERFLRAHGILPAA
ncbi:MAG: alpha/beta hydrolase [Phycisphaerae bacterium]